MDHKLETEGNRSSGVWYSYDSWWLLHAGPGHCHCLRRKVAVRPIAGLLALSLYISAQYISPIIPPIIIIALSLVSANSCIKCCRFDCIIAHKVTLVVNAEGCVGGAGMSGQCIMLWFVWRPNDVRPMHMYLLRASMVTVMLGMLASG